MTAPVIINGSRTGTSNTLVLTKPIGVVEGDTMVAFTDGYRRYGLNPLGGDDEGNSRAMRARAAEKAGERGSEGALQRVAERLIAHFLPAFVFGNVAYEDSVYWVDLRLPQPPLRMARMPALAEPSQRFFKPPASISKPV